MKKILLLGLAVLSLAAAPMTESTAQTKKDFPSYLLTKKDSLVNVDTLALPIVGVPSFIGTISVYVTATKVSGTPASYGFLFGRNSTTESWYQISGRAVGDTFTVGNTAGVQAKEWIINRRTGNAFRMYKVQFITAGTQKFYVGGSYNFINPD